MTTAITDTRRITEADPDFLRIRNRVRRQLASSVNRYARDLRSGKDDARQRFVHRHVDILYAGYVAAHKAGQQDYWGSVSLQKHPSSDPPHGLVMQRMAFYAPSVTRMALEGESAYHASQARTFADSTPDGGASALDEWQGDLGVRLQLQADLAWSGMQDGYLDGGAGDEANPYAQVWWNLEPLAEHCTDCPDLAAGSPYDPPGSGGNELNQTPGDGNTICGANCKCDLTYQPGRGDGAQIGAVLPKNMPSLDQVGGTFAVPNPVAADLTDNQKAGLDALRAAMRQWEKVRGDRPSLPSAFDPEAALDLGDWEDLTPEQHDALDAYLNGLISWSVATNIANLSESFVFFNPNHLPSGPGGGEFAPKGEGGGGEGVTHVSHHVGGSGGGGAGAGGSYKAGMYLWDHGVTYEPTRQGDPQLHLQHEMNGSYTVQAGNAPPARFGTLAEANQHLMARGVPQSELQAPPPARLNDARSPEPGKVVMTTRGHDIEITAHENADRTMRYDVHLHPTTTPRYTALDEKATEEHHDMTQKELNTWLSGHDLAHGRVFAALAAEDAHALAHADPERINAVNARRAELDTRYGAYSDGALASHMQDVFQRYPGLEEAAALHYQGGVGTHFDEQSVATAMAAHVQSNADSVKAGLKELQDLSEWSMLHSNEVAPDGTIRLFHGTNGNTSGGEWVGRFRNNTQRAGIPFTTSWHVARGFASSGAGGHMVLTARVPIEMVSMHYRMHGSGFHYQSEEEYTVGHGTTKMRVITVGSESPNGALAEWGHGKMRLGDEQEVTIDVA
jgi:hypothetical protein